MLNRKRDKEQYIFERIVKLEIEDGYYLLNPSTNQETGMLFDTEFYNLKKGKRIRRTVEETKDNTIFTRQVRPPGENMYQRTFRLEGTGLIKDTQGFPTYPFSPGTDIEIKIIKKTDEIIIIKISEVIL